MRKRSILTAEIATHFFITATFALSYVRLST